MNPALSLLELAQLPVTDATLADADLALGRALLSVGQDYLARVSDHWDVELFYEVYNKPPASGGWAETIMVGLEKRPDIPDEDRATILNDALVRASTRLNQESGGAPS